MKSYSKVFKASHLSIVNEVKVISTPLPSINQQVEEWESVVVKEASEDLEHQILEAAKVQAQVILSNAEQKAMSLEREAQEKVNQWWKEKEKNLEMMSLEAQQQGYDVGFEKGGVDAEKQIQQDYQEKMVQVQHLLQCAYEQKEAIIAEAEPFLLELSTAIASQIIKQELEGNPDKFVELIKHHILRFKEKEFITVCVHPDDFDFIQSQRAHLGAVVNGETEIKVIPDHTVTPNGCMIRTAYGSVDARIDTQLEVIKKVILEVGRDSESDIIS
ncbi:FliH/SctL family protein [Bacillus sp. 1NLA3E]|uniref:FliH/SctL family protein n=1 Tax=Bacillus sp. 1NLA3E TaxID=666686 RepID=UPI000247F31D|nr:FliH/SctL family protein [Bacillus sp. 1NLA3E]AGK55368.1 flagellar assembly protein FliH [Bacillus sp. 1NLA3E]